MELEDEEPWLRQRVIRLRMALRFTQDPRTDAGLKEFIADAEERLENLQKKRILEQTNTNSFVGRKA